MREMGDDTEEVTLSRDESSPDEFTRYRVSLFNEHGLGEATEANKVDPFYKTWWFLVIIALAALVIIIIITAVLCCYCFRMRGKAIKLHYVLKRLVWAKSLITNLALKIVLYRKHC